jgi:uncharacterized membrane protein
MGAFFPVLAIPIGIVFLMLDDKRRAQIGWWNIIAGVVGTVVHTVVTGLLASAIITPMIYKGMDGLLSMKQRQAQSQDLNSEAPPLNLPGQGQVQSPGFQNPPN